MVEGLLDVGRAVGLASDIDGVGGSAREGLLESDEELAGRRRGHRARHVDMCVCVLVGFGCNRSVFEKSMDRF